MVVEQKGHRKEVFASSQPISCSTSSSQCAHAIETISPFFYIRSQLRLLESPPPSESSPYRKSVAYRCRWDGVVVLVVFATLAVALRRASPL
jgi:hypothetical protein